MSYDPLGCFTCPCGREAPCSNTADSDSAAPKSTLESGPTEPDLSDPVTDETESWAIS